MYGVMTSHVDQLDALHDQSDGLIAWGCPVPFFGDLVSAHTATVGINPSNREFTDGNGVSLKGAEQRLPTLDSLGVARWRDVDALDLKKIIDACMRYFRRNPYNRWFKVLEHLLRPAGLTYYGARPSACHLDLVPFATAGKWGTLASAERRGLLASSEEALGLLVRDSSLQLLVLNGRSVVDHFEVLTHTQLDRTMMVAWDLPREGGSAVPGMAYSGDVTEVGGVTLNRSVKVVGYNHNLQSSFGVTNGVVSSIGRWLAMV